MNNISMSKKDKYICYCERVTYDTFTKAINNNSADLNLICNNLKIAQKCMACLPNIEDMMVGYKSKSNISNNIVFGKKNISIYKKILNYIDDLCGHMNLSLRGTLPAVVSKNIETWLVISNNTPSQLLLNNNDFKLECIIYDENGNIVNKVNNHVSKNNTLKLCINDYVKFKNKDLSIYTIDVIRHFISKGYRGSTRPHFYYKTSSSMAALHTQDGGTKNLSFDMIVGNKKEKRWLFISNLKNQNANVDLNFLYTKRDKKIPFIEDSIIISSRGSKLIEVPTYKENMKISILLNSDTLFKTNLIISDNKFKYISVDHL